MNNTSNTCTHSIKHRIEYLDIARTIAIILVVFCHSVELVYSMTMQDWICLSIQSKIFRTVTFTIGRLGVPIFLFISGWLLLNKKYDNDEDIKKFYKKNLLPLILATEIWIIVYNIFIAIYNNKDYSLQSLVKEMLFFKKVPLENMWYMPMIIGIYIAIPFISKILENFSFKVIKIPMALVFALTFILPTLNIILKTFDFKQQSNILDITFLGGIYGLYIISGYFISKGALKELHTKWIIIMCITFFILSCAIQIFEYQNSIEYNIWYNSPFIFLCTINLFEIFTRLNTEKINKNIIKICTYLSKISLSIYFIHIIVEKILRIYINAIALAKPIKVMILFIISFIISVIVIWILSKIAIIKNKVLIIKD